MICLFCKSEYKRKDGYISHLNTHLNDEDIDKIKLQYEIDKYSKELNKFKCHTCNKKFSTGYTLRRHRNTKCLPSNNKIKTSDASIIQMKELFREVCPNLEDPRYIKFMSLADQQLSEQSNSNNNNVKLDGGNNVSNIVGTGTINQITNNINNNEISLRNFNQEYPNYEMFEKDKKLGTKSIRDIYEKNKTYQKVLVETMCNIWCNKNYPENHNIYVNAQHEKFTKIFQDNQWKQLRTTDVLNTAVEQANIFMNGDIDKYTEGITDEQFEKASDVMTESYFDDKTMKKKAMRDFHDELYLNKDMIKETYEKTRE